MDDLAEKIGPYWSREVDPGDKRLLPAERLWVPFDEIAKRLYERYPDRKIMALAYHPTLIPSQKIKKFPPNVIIELCRYGPRDFDAYSAHKDKTVYIYWWGAYQVQGLTPKPLSHQIARNVRTLAGHGVLGIYVCGGGELWGLEGPAYYVFAKLAWDPQRDEDKILDDYYRGVFHQAAGVMKEFFDLLEERVAVGHKTQSAEDKKRNFFYLRSADYFPAAYPPGVLARLDGLLQKAKGKVENDDLAKNWLALTDLQYRYLKIVATGFNLYKEYRKSEDLAVRRKLAEAVDARKEFLKELEGLKDDQAYLSDWFPGWDVYMSYAPSGGSIYGRVDNRPPFNGEF